MYIGGAFLESDIDPALGARYPPPLAFPFARRSVYMSQAHAECPAPSVTFNEGAYSSHTAELQKILVVTSLVWGLYGT